MRSKVEVVDDEELVWPFHGSPYVPNGRYRTDIDPTPAYAHRVEDVAKTLLRCERAFAPASPLTVTVSHFEDLGRTNGWSMKHSLWGDDQTPERPWDGVVFLSGKRIPPHPAVTRYVTAHEYGHHVQWWLEHELGLDEGELVKDYAEFRALDVDPAYGAGRWHDHPAEVFACDFRIVVAEIEPEYWPHPGVPMPGDAERGWWKSTLLARYDRFEQRAA